MRTSSIFDVLNLTPRFVLQPIFAQYDGVSNLIGMEALLRLSGKEGQAVNLGAFFSYVSKNNLLVEVDRAIFSMVTHWLGENHALVQEGGLLLHMNVTPQSFKSQDFMGQVLSEVKNNPSVMQHICMELVESYDLSDISAISKSLFKLKDEGVPIALDDFGSGFMGVKQIVYFNPDFVKLDYCITSKLSSDLTTMEFAQRVRQVTGDLGIHLLAEGVERTDMLKAAQQLGVESIQGRLVSKELEVGDFVAFAEKEQQNQMQFEIPSYSTMRGG